MEDLAGACVWSSLLWSVGGVRSKPLSLSSHRLQRLNPEARARDNRGVSHSGALPGVAKRDQLEKRREFRVGGDLQDLLTVHLLNWLCTLACELHTLQVIVLSPITWVARYLKLSGQSKGTIRDLLSILQSLGSVPASTTKVKGWCIWWQKARL